jgi:pullulanase/glycogen debranching enzyme
MTSWATAEGLPYPLGVSWCADDGAYNFALYSKHATAVRLLLFGEDVEVPRAEIALDPLIVVRDDARIELVNVQTATMFGYSRDELVGSRSRCSSPSDSAATTSGI